MLTLLLVSPDNDTFKAFESAAATDEDVDLIKADSGEKALKLAQESGFDLVVADEDLGDMTGLHLANRLITINPMINCAVVSSLSPENFHEKSEGLGLMAQLSVKPGQEAAKKLLQNLREIKRHLS